MVISGVTIVCPSRSTLQYLRLTLGPKLVIGVHIPLDENNQIICVGDVGLFYAITCLHSEPNKGLNVPRVMTVWW